MIKNDKWIKSKCMVPLGFLSFLVPFPTLSEPGGVQSLKSTEQGYRVTKAVYGDPFTNLDEAQKEILINNKAIEGTAIFTLISDYEVENFKPMIEPFLPMQVREAETDVLVGHMVDDSTGQGDPVYAKTKIISKGLTSFGYDVSLDKDFKIFTNINSKVIDPLNFSEETLHHITANDHVLLPPNSYLLGHTPEYFRMPRNVLALCVGKSTYARCGVIINVTPIEPGFEGQVVIEIVNGTNLPVKIYVNQGIAQFIFFEGEECETSYSDRNKGEGGKYQGQRGVTLAKG